MRSSIILMSCAWAATGCAGIKFDPADGGVGAGGSGVVTSTGGASNGGAGVGGNTSASEVCAQTHDGVKLTMTRNGITDGITADPASRDLTFTMIGEIVACDATSFSLIGCPGPDGTVCKTNETIAFTVDAAGLSLTRALKIGAFARVDIHQDCPWGCNTSIILESIDSLYGINNPYPAASGIYLAANDGGGTPSGVPYAIEEILLDCANPYTGGCGGSQQIGLYALRFSSAASQTPVDVHMGEAPWIRAGNGWLQVRNLRSFVTGWCDDYWNWAHWAVDGTPEY